MGKRNKKSMDEFTNHKIGEYNSTYIELKPTSYESSFLTRKEQSNYPLTWLPSYRSEMFIKIYNTMHTGCISLADHLQYTITDGYADKFTARKPD